MKLFVPTIAILLSSTASAAECYSSSGSKTCVSPSRIYDFYSAFCRDYWRAGDTTKSYVDDTNGRIMTISKTGSIPDEQACLTSTGNIVDQCYGKRNGGSWSIPSYSITFNFCG